MSCDSQYPWWDRFIAKAHTEIECDPSVWNQVEDLIRSNLPSVATATAQSPPTPSPSLTLANQRAN